MLQGSYVSIWLQIWDYDPGTGPLVLVFFTIILLRVHLQADSLMVEL